ncbi:acyl-CoA dehydrogenase family protein [Streptomyces sp. NPDC055775]
MDAADFKAVRDAVRRLVREDVVPREDEIEETDAIPDDVRRKAVDMGLFGYTLPEEHGGLGATLYEDVQLAFEFGYTTPAFRSMFGTDNGIAGKVLVNAGTEEQQKHWSAAKPFCSEMVSKAADLAVQIHGGMGYMRGTVVERCFRDARLFRIYEGTSEIQKLIIGRALLKDVK